MFAGKKSAQIREILISESAWEEMTCLFAPSLTSRCINQRGAGHQRELPSLRDGPRPEKQISYSIQKEVHHKTGAGLPAKCPSPPLKSEAAPGRRPGTTSLLMMDVVTRILSGCE